MDPAATATATAGAMSTITSHFMLDPATYATATEQGYEGLDFYGVGRGGVLGQVPADVVAAAFVFFNPDTVREAWARGTQVAPVDVSAQRFAQAGHAWAEAHLADGPDWARLAALLGTVVASARAAGAPVFAGWRTLPEPDGDPKLLAFHRLNAMRELRMAMHAIGVLAEGLTPHEAVSVKSPTLTWLFGWPEATPTAATPEKVAAWDRGEATTDRLVGAHLAVLDQAERAELTDLCAAAQAAVS